MADKYINVGGHKVTTDREIEHTVITGSASNCNFTLNFYKKDKVVYCSFGWAATANIAQGATASVSNLVPTSLRPIGGALALNGISTTIYRAYIDSSGNVSLWAINGSIGNNFSSVVYFTYLTA